MSTNSNRIISIYKARTVILEQLESRGYQVKDYMRFSINEVDAMFTNSQLDMLIVHENGSKAYIKFYFTLKQTTKQIRPQTLDDIIQDLYEIDDVLTKNDTLIIIIDDEPNDTILAKLKYLYDHDGIFVIIHNIKRLQTNILTHQLVPFMTILSEEEKEQLMKDLNIQDGSQFPEISRFDPQALAVGVRPGQVCSIQRNSVTAMTYNYYRICV
jgi:DNA-directed RNA polymerase I, II, and III subunit RPABC1